MKKIKEKKISEKASLYVQSGVSQVELSFSQQTAHLRRGFAFDGTADKKLFKLIQNKKQSREWSIWQQREYSNNQIITLFCYNICYT